MHESATVSIAAGPVELEGELVAPEAPRGVVLFADVSSSARKRPRYQRVAEHLVAHARVDTLFVHVLSEEEEKERVATAREPSSEVAALAQRILSIRDWLARDPRTAGLPVGYFGAGTGGGAALLAASLRADVGALVSAGGRPDLVPREAIEKVAAPTLLVVGEHEASVLEVNLAAQSSLRCESELVIVPQASHLFEDPSTLDEVARLASDWFSTFLRPAARASEADTTRTSQRPGEGPEAQDEALERVREALRRSAVLPDVDVARATAAVMSAVADRLTSGEAHELLETLSVSIRALVAARTRGRARPPIKLDRAELVARIASDLEVTPAHAEAVAAVVLAAVRAELPDSVVAHVASQLPRDLKDLWLARAPLAPPSMPAVNPRPMIERAIAERVRLPRGVDAVGALTAVLSAFSARLSGGEAWDVLLGLPDDVRPLLEDAMLDRAEPAHVFDRNELVAKVADHLGVTIEDARPLIPAVLGVVKRMLPVKEIDDVASQLPLDLRELWLAA